MRIETRPCGHTREMAAAQRASLQAAGRIRLDDILRRAGHLVEIKQLRAGRGGLQACVATVDATRFRFVCDPAASPGEPPDVAQLVDPERFRVSFRLAHELAHTAFQRMHFGDRRLGKGDPLEQQCDEFAVLFLVGENEACRAVNEGDAAVEELAQTLDIPSRLVRDAAALAS